jgi:hypothetical protein
VPFFSFWNHHTSDDFFMLTTDDLVLGSIGSLILVFGLMSCGVQRIFLSESSALTAGCISLSTGGIVAVNSALSSAGIAGSSSAGIAQLSSACTAVSSLIKPKLNNNFIIFVK